MNIYHYHHIVPKHMGGTDDESNLVKLSIQEHAQAHKDLYDKYGKWQDYLAWQSLSGQITHAEASQLARKYRDTSYMQTPEYRKKMSESKQGNIPWNKGKTGVQKISDDTRSKLSKSSGGSNNPRAKPCIFKGNTYQWVGGALKDSGYKTREALYNHPEFKLL